jgi:hypothetical protein
VLASIIILVPAKRCPVCRAIQERPGV